MTTEQLVRNTYEAFRPAICGAWPVIRLRPSSPRVTSCAETGGITSASNNPARSQRPSGPR